MLASGTVAVLAWSGLIRGFAQAFAVLCCVPFFVDSKAVC